MMIEIFFQYIGVMFVGYSLGKLVEYFVKKSKKEGKK